MKVSDFDYELPKELIAQDPLLDRSSSRLLVMDKNNGKILHKHFFDIIDYLNKDDVLVLNESKVIPARLIGTIKNTSHICEIFLIKRLSSSRYECLVKPGKKLKIDTIVNFGNGELNAKIIEIKEDGNRIVEFMYDGIFEEILDKLGNVPLPPYIIHELKDKNRYQTVYAKNEGSVAAPTAGLHFTNELLSLIEKKGVKIVKLTLHVSLGTFRPLKVLNIEDHVMHKEEVFISEEVCNIINTAKEQGNKIICVGTTSCRSVESASYYDEEKKMYKVKEFHGDTGIFIYPGYKFKILDSLITNFHLPKSTLIMLVSALCGREHILNAYNEAIKEKYRFYSFGDACLFTDLNVR